MMNKDFCSLRNALTPLYGECEARAIAFLVMEDAFGVTRTDIYADKVRQFSADERQRMLNICQRVRNGEPVQQAIGHALFCGHRICVNKDVLIPRPETEELVDWVLEIAKSRQSTRILDAGTGSGCIAISLSLALPSASVTAWDVSDAALHTARLNAERLGADIRFEHHDMLNSGNPNCAFDVMVSNPPYVCEHEKAEMEQQVLNHEPHLALFVPDSDPLLFYRALAKAAINGWLAPGGWLLTEVNRAFAADTARLYAEAGLCNATVRRDAFGNERMVGAQMPEQ